MLLPVLFSTLLLNAGASSALYISPDAPGPKARTSPGSSPPATRVGCLYEVEGVGSFTQTHSYNFANATTFPETLVKSNYVVGSKPQKHRFVPTLVHLGGGYLNLDVPGGQSHTGTIQSAEFSSVEGNILYASVRTTAIFSDVPGTCNAAFFYQSDSQEIDIEYLTDPNSESNPHGKQPLQLTNQATDGNPKDATFAESPSPADRTTVAHEYRIDWIAGKSIFYLDGVKIKEFTTNVPTKPGNFVWNNWADGDPGWTVGPPKTLNRFKIQKIVMYFNTTTSQGQC